MPGVGRRHAQCPDVEVWEARRLGEQACRAGLLVHDEREDEQELRDAEGGDDAHEVGDVAQPSDDDDLRGRADAGRQRQRRGQCHPVRDVPLDDGHAENGGAEGADLAVREVDELVRPEDEHEPDGQQAVGDAGDGAEQEYWARELEAGDQIMALRAPARSLFDRGGNTAPPEPPCEAVGFAASRLLMPAAAPFEEDGAEQVAAFQEVAGLAVEADLALLHEVRVVDERQRDVHRLLDEHDRRPVGVDAADHLEQLGHDLRSEAERELVDQQAAAAGG